ncbi:hypothetical protein VZ232_06100 [Pseudomonas aeruginosa]|jgi:hypothetical protein|uniref:hypothetical protein n=1 Tax=Pseudomonas aeruginosa TaxID=287 RepID=UPI000BB6E82C|nr:hypothetical protein [Pseudomonas aeruginosa]MCU9524391.1 hypothetical protein [Pseudomonas aeruginosa]MED6062846.1 hypothetical protein [Pseudomonas aeruginosa]PCB51197.1 hypothetical protein CJT85_29620 [Pseudomonas aeruginosa]WGL62013.1 hypothetical protein QDX81_13435 [Pseudomonas sp. CW003PS]
MHNYPLHAVEADVLLHEGDLLVELARRPGVEILPLLKGRLAGLLKPEITSISIADDGLIRVLSTELELSECGGEPPFASMQPVQRTALNLFEAVTLPRSVRANIDPAPGLSPAMLEWAAQACLEPSVAMSLRLVDAAALPLLEACSAADELDEHKTAVKLLLDMGNAFAELLLPTLDRKVIEASIQKLSGMPPFGFVDGCDSYWAEICALDTGFMFAEQVAADVRAKAEEALAELSAEERLALLLSKQDCDDWLHDRIGDQNTPEHIQLLEQYLDTDLLLSDLVEGVLHEAAGQGALRASGQGELFS